MKKQLIPNFYPEEHQTFDVCVGIGYTCLAEKPWNLLTNNTEMTYCDFGRLEVGFKNGRDAFVGFGTPEGRYEVEQKILWNGGKVILSFEKRN